MGQRYSPTADACRTDDVTICRMILTNSRRMEATFYERYQPRAVGWALRRVEHRQDAEDLAQDALLTVLARLRSQSLADPAALAGYVRRTVDFTVINHLRKQARRRTSSVGDWPADLSPVDDCALEQIARSRVRQRLRALVGELRQARDRDLLRMSYFEDKPKPVICEALGLSPIQFDRLIFRAKQRLRQLALGCDEITLE